MFFSFVLAVSSLVLLEGCQGDAVSASVEEVSDAGSLQEQPDGPESSLDASPNLDGETGGQDAPPNGTWLSGVGGKGEDVDGTFGNWRGRPNEICGVWTDWRIVALRPGGDHASFTGPIDLAVPGITKKGGESWAAAARGDYESRWREAFTLLKTYREGKATTYVRFAAEFNGSWSDTSVTGAEVADFLTAWRRFRAVQLSIFPASKLVWCPNDGTSADQLDVRDAFPGASYVDVIGVDSYNAYPSINTEAAFRSRIQQTESNGAPHGIETWRRFAESQGLPMALSEWGAVGPDEPHGGDSPGYMPALYAWLVEHGGVGPGRVLYEVLFNVTPNFELWPETKQPQAAEAYRSTW
jgi:hypothetical protein